MGLGIRLVRMWTTLHDRAKHGCLNCYDAASIPYEILLREERDGKGEVQRLPILRLFVGTDPFVYYHMLHYLWYVLCLMCHGSK